MKKIFVMVLSIALTAAILVGCTHASEPIRIGAALDNLDDPFWLGIQFGMDRAMKELGEKAAISYQVAQGDAVRQEKQIEDMVTAGVDAIVCVYVDMDAIMQSVRLCNEKGIPFVFSDRPVINTDEIKADWGISTDNYQLSFNGWKWSAEYAKKNGMILNVLELQGSLADDNVLKRADGLRHVQKDNTEVINIVQSVPTEWNLERCLAGVTNALSAHPEINCIFLMSDFLIPPVIQALQAADRFKTIGDPDHVFLMGYSGSAEAVRLMQEKYMDMCFGMDVIKTGYESVMAAYALATGDKTTYTTPVDDPGFIMTQENLDETSKMAYGTNVN